MSKDRYATILNFYLRATEQKYNLKKKEQKIGEEVTTRAESVAEHVFGACILAINLDSEFDINVNLEKVLKMLILHEIGEKGSRSINDLELCYHSLFKQLLLKVKKKFKDIRLSRTIGSLAKKEELIDLIREFEKGVTPEAKFARYCDRLETNFESGMYQDEIWKFYLLTNKLKQKIRSGWDEEHWNITCERIESVAEHIFGTCILAIGLDSEIDFGIDLGKTVKMLVSHEEGEVLIGDITPFDGITPEEKKKIEHKAIIDVAESLTKKDQLVDLIFEFDERKTPEASFAHYCDKLEADIQAKVYQDRGYHRSLDDQEGNVVFKSDKVQRMINNGAKTPFDIWYWWDKPIYKDSSVFTEILEYVKDHSTYKKRLGKSVNFDRNGS